MAVHTYSSYLKIDQLLSLQQPASAGPDGAEHDEMLFIIIHQVYELWFKQILHEIDRLPGDLAARRIPEVQATFKRILTILKTLVAQIDVLETMTPVAFNSFRARLDSASGFQSVQFRTVELALGLRRKGMLTHLTEGSPERARVERRQAQPGLYHWFLHFLAAGDHPVPPELLDRDPLLPPPEDEAVRRLLVEIYRHHPTEREICERLVDLDEGIQEWRYRHVKMVERTIGTKQGTGGSAGAAYLRATLFTPLYPDLWAIRTEL